MSSRWVTLAACGQASQLSIIVMARFVQKTRRYLRMRMATLNPKPFPTQAWQGTRDRDLALASRALQRHAGWSSWMGQALPFIEGPCAP